jgi:PPK2 family polyphosphate:nucleotide phosphotransferase
MSANDHRHGSRRLIEQVRVVPGEPARLRARQPDDKLGLADKVTARQRLDVLTAELAVLQNRLYAEGRRAVLFVLQGTDASGKDGTIRMVLSGVNPQGVQVTSFKAPTHVELAHDFLWRIHAASPARGEIGVFNRSHYEDLVTVFVKAIGGPHDDRWWKQRARHIEHFEQLLHDSGTTVVKCYLHVSAAEQQRRFAERLNDPEKAWKFRAEDLADARHFDDFVTAYDRAISDTSTATAPWHVVPADRNWVRNLVVAELLVATLSDMDPQLPPPSADLLAARAAAVKDGPVAADTAGR